MRARAINCRAVASPAPPRCQMLKYPPLAPLPDPEIQRGDGFELFNLYEKVGQAKPGELQRYRCFRGTNKAEVRALAWHTACGRMQSDGGHLPCAQSLFRQLHDHVLPGTNNSPTHASVLLALFLLQYVSVARCPQPGLARMFSLPACVGGTGTGVRTAGAATRGVHQHQPHA